MALRRPGYPGFLAVRAASTGKTGADARLWAMLAQVIVDLAGCLVIAWLAEELSSLNRKNAKSRRVFVAALWLSALCPFTANYTAVLLTETMAIFFTAVALFFFIRMATASQNLAFAGSISGGASADGFWTQASLGALATGFGTLFRPETPLLLLIVWLVLAGVLFRQGQASRWIRMVLLTGAVCMAPLLPWAIRNAVTLHEVQFLAPRNPNLNREMTPYGFMAWEKTWLYRVKDCYLVPWKLNEEAIHVEDIPERAFDNAEEKQRVAAILEQYNNDLTLNEEEDARFAQLARERTARHPLRRYVVTAGLFLLKLFYAMLAVCGVWLLWRRNFATRSAVVLLVSLIVARTAFLTTLETPEPRYVLECFPALIALAAQVFVRGDKTT